MHHFVTLSGVAAVLLALWAVQLTMLALHVRYTIRNGVGDGITEDSEIALLFGVGIATVLSAAGGGGAIGSGLHAIAWGWADAVLALGTTASYLLLTYATDWDAEEWWNKRRSRKAGPAAEGAETA
ncbi:hypothetical protein AB0F71_31130 [Kitasatospora sp. NPDC028055]|uniref:hypothetical protein n=1 Tax=Kitasatospora sp. NPDC028055 TaxID=3155653 RepID=UPI0033C02116